MTTAGQIETAAGQTESDKRIAEEAAQKPVAEAEEKSVTIIFNPVSGQTDPEQRKKVISDALATHGYRSQYLVTSPKETAQFFAKQAIEYGADLVGVSGGDGTVLEVMTALIGTKTPVAVFPAGTGNLLSVNLGLSREVPLAVDAALDGDRRAIDLARITPYAAREGEAAKPGSEDDEPQYFAILAGAGYDAYLIQGADREAKNRLGMGAYFLSALRSLRHRRTWAAIRLDHAAKPIRVRAKSVMVANMGRLQGGVEVIPDALPDDGILDVAVLKAETLGQWLSLVWSVLRHRVRDDASIDYYQARHIEIRLSRPQPLQLDGESLEKMCRGFDVEIMPKAVEIMTPKSSPV